MRSTANIFGISEQSLSNIVQELTGAIVAELDEEFISNPKRTSSPGGNKGWADPVFFEKGGAQIKD